MIHTELDLPTHLYEDIERIAKKNKRPMPQVLRELIDAAVVDWYLRQSTRRTNEHRLDGLVNLKLRGPKDLAQNIDHYLYDDEQ